jgi:predicted short-subunit dehydrogenase-like oxidoreductase (DUF2520 family)
MSPEQNRPAPDITILGVGRLGTALALALQNAGYVISALVGRRSGSAKRAAKLLDAPTRVLGVKDIPSLSPRGIFILSTPDDQVSTVADDLSKLRVSRTSPVVLHTSGALSSSVLVALHEKGWSVGSIHPLISVSEPGAGSAALEGAYWCVEGDQKAIKVARQLVRSLHGESFSIQPEAKPLYHAAAVMASGNIVAVFDVAIEMLIQCGVTRRNARRFLQPLIESAVENLNRTDPANALTGTIARADEATVNRHLIALSSPRLKSADDLYRMIGQRAVALARRQGADESALNRINKRLQTKR